MELSLESDAEALWQDALDLLSQEDLPESVLAMLRNCTPTRISNGTLYIETPMRLVLKTVSKNIEVVEKCLTTAAFEKTNLVVEFARTTQAPTVTTNSTASQEQIQEWSSVGAPPRVLGEDTWNEEEVEAENKIEKRRRRKANPLVEDISENDSKLTFDRFVIGDENRFAYQAALQVANGENKSYNPLFIYGKSGLGKTHLLRAIQNYIARTTRRASASIRRRQISSPTTPTPSAASMAAPPIFSPRTTATSTSSSSMTFRTWPVQRARSNSSSIPSTYSSQRESR